MKEKITLRKKIVFLEDRINALEKKEESKNNFFAMTVHELRTPLNSIVGLTSILMERAIAEEELEYISQVNMSSKLLSSLVNDILDFSKIEAGKLNIEYIDCNIELLFKNIKTILDEQATIKGLDLLFEINDNMPKNISSDFLRLTQILLNLASNAIKFTKEGSISIKAKLLPKIADKEYIEFCVTDTGIGLSQEQQSKLFTTYSQAESSTSREYGGTGLGLNISKTLCELMGGTIRIESELDKGSNFIFTIEYKHPSNVIVKTNKDIIEDLESQLQTFKDAHILMAEDNTINQSVIIALLKDTGINITMANNGQEAIDIMDDIGESIDLILMDINMPILGGLEASTYIRKNLKYLNTPIIAFSGDSDDKIRAKVENAGMDDIIFKPIVIKEFYTVLQKHLKSSQTIEERYIDSSKYFDDWLNNYEYQKIASLISSIKREHKTSKNTYIIESALRVESAIEKYKELFLVLMANHSKAVNALLKCVNTLESHDKLTGEENLEIFKIMDNFSISKLQSIIDFAEKLKNSTKELIALVLLLKCLYLLL